VANMTKEQQRQQRRQLKRQAKQQQRTAKEQRLAETRPVANPQPKPNPAPLSAKTEGQLSLIQAINSSSQVIVTGPAGTGKSFIPASMAADWLASGRVSKIVLCRPMVSVGKSMGYLPGDQDEKMQPWMVPLIEPLQQRLGKGFVEYCLKSGKIEVAPIETMRGRTFKDAFVIVDEAQNLSLHELKMLVTRVGENTQLVIDGDVAQTDLNNSGLDALIHLSKRHNIDCVAVTLGLEDIVRSGIVRQWLTAFHHEGM